MIPDGLVALQNWARDASGVQFIWRDDNAPRPESAYGTIRVLSAIPSDHASIGSVDEFGRAAVVNHYEVVTSLQLYARGELPMAALARMRAIRQSLSQPSVLLNLNQIGGWAFVNVLMGPMDTPAVVGTEHEPRATMDVQWRVAAQTFDELGLVERIAIEGTADGRLIMDEEVAL